ncbi:MAG: amidase, hydantoinase/carbamoylase family [Acidobacteria bacterium]|nr:amidase, hydantoinase/carbamoylase family [Acidobacteriota bacterium]
MDRRVRLAACLQVVLTALSVTVAGHGPDLRINGKRVNGHLLELSRFGKNPEGGVTRVAYSDVDLQGRAYVIQLMRDAGLDVVIDAAGNIVGRRAGADPGKKPIVVGSHIDSVPQGGNYDGNVGSMAAIEVAQSLAEQGVALRHPLEVVIFQNEEGGTVGSMAITAGLSNDDLARTTHSGATVREGIRRIGGDPDRLAQAIRKPGDIAAYLELHIEQGGILDAEDVDIGVVEGIVGIKWWDVTIEGSANHAGTTPMAQRRDALLAAARYVDAVNRVARARPGRQVATVGRIQAFPGAYNVIPGKVATSLEIRDLDASVIDAIRQDVQREVELTAQDTGTTFTFTLTSDTVPAPTDTRVRRTIDEAAARLGLRRKSMPSGAGHDAQEMARLGPIGMIFVPSVGGISHSPREFTRPEDITNGTNVLLHAILGLDDDR